MTVTTIAAHKLRDYADTLRLRADATNDHRVWRSCRELADCLDALLRSAGDEAMSGADSGRDPGCQD